MNNQVPNTDPSLSGCPRCDHPMDRHTGHCHHIDSCEGRECGCTYRLPAAVSAKQENRPVPTGVMCICCGHESFKTSRALCDYCFMKRIEDSRHQCVAAVSEVDGGTQPFDEAGWRKCVEFWKRLATNYREKLDSLKVVAPQGTVEPRETRLAPKNQMDWKEVMLTTDWGFETMFVCPACAAIVKDKDIHNDFHVRVRN